MAAVTEVAVISAHEENPDLQTGIDYAAVSSMLYAEVRRVQRLEQLAYSRACRRELYDGSLRSWDWLLIDSLAEYRQEVYSWYLEAAQKLALVNVTVTRETPLGEGHAVHDPLYDWQEWPRDSFLPTPAVFASVRFPRLRNHLTI